VSDVNFTEIARRYERDSVVQKTAAERLISLLEIGPEEDVLDLGCGPGHLAARISQITSGRVVGVDASPGMIAEARAKYASQRIPFQNGAAENLLFDQEFDVIFCNSALHWFREPARGLTACRRALRPGGRMGVQAPARHDYSPNFLKAIAEVARHPETSATFSRFRGPWLFFETADEYAALFRNAGFVVPFARIETTRARYSPEQVITVFESGAAAGYLNAANYEGSMPPGYAEAFRRIVAGSFRAQAASDGQVELQFHRAYLVAVRPRPLPRTA
jgi:ubiquinone/menaquinone biosynthesis C-methylase UbiE